MVTGYGLRREPRTPNPERRTLNTEPRTSYFSLQPLSLAQPLVFIMHGEGEEAGEDHGSAAEGDDIHGISIKHVNDQIP